MRLVSFKLAKACSYFPGLDPKEKAVLKALADFADEDGRKAFPSVSRLVYMTAFSERSVQRALETLTIRCLITPVSPTCQPRKHPTGGRWKTTEYQIEVEEIMQMSEFAIANEFWNKKEEDYWPDE